MEEATKELNNLEGKINYLVNVFYSAQAKGEELEEKIQNCINELSQKEKEIEALKSELQNRDLEIQKLTNQINNILT